MSTLPRHGARRSVSFLTIPMLAVAIAGCSGAGAVPATAPASAAPATPSATPIPTAAPDGVGAIDHPTGAKDVVLRYGEGGGFVMPSYLATLVPHFTMYGDGTVVYRNPALEGPQPQGSVFRMNPMRTAKLTERQIQDVLALALGEGGLAGARPQYQNDHVADASTATFTINAGGVSKTVSVYALGIEAGQGADSAARAAFAKLAGRLTDFDQGGVYTTAVYQPNAYRGLLLEAPGMTAPDTRVWPWPTLKPADFKVDADPAGVQFPHRPMTPAELDALEIKDYQGGFQGLPLKAPDGKTYTFSVRPLLPDEAS